MHKEKVKKIEVAKQQKELEKLFTEPQKNPDRWTQDEKDKKLYDMYLQKSLVNIKNVVLKNAEQRTVKEVEFLILYMKHKFPIFYEIDRRTLEYFVRRLSFSLYKPGESLVHKGEDCTGMIIFIDGEVEARTKTLKSSLRRQSSTELMLEMQYMSEGDRGYL